MYYYKQVIDNVITSVESKSVKVASPGFIEAVKLEYDVFIASLPITEPALPLVFTASPPGEALGNRLNNIEDFLVRCYS